MKVYHHLSKFGCHRDCARGDIMVLVGKVILQDTSSKGDVTL